MIPPVGMAIAALTVMLWIVWSDTLRPQRPGPAIYVVRIGLYLIMAAILIVNMIRYPQQYSGAARGFSIVAVLVGVFGAAYFARRLVRRV